MVDINKLRGTGGTERDLQQRIQEEERRQSLAKEQKTNKEKEEQTLARLLHEKAGLSANEAAQVAKTVTDEKHKNDEKIEAGDKIIDMSFLLANSLQMLYSETDPVQEYHSWIEDASKVISAMNDGEITHNDLDMKNNFIANLDQRENEIKAVMSLYRSSNFEGSKKQLAFLQYKWQRLMELRNVVKNTTKNHVSEKYNQQEKNKAAAALTILPLMAADEQKRMNNEDLLWDGVCGCMLYMARGHFMANSLPDVYGQDDLLPEYKNFINNAGEVIRNMNDGEISAKDITSRNDFLHNVNVRESMLLVHLSLYENRNDPFAMKQKAYLKYKLERLMEIKNAVVNNTKSEAEAFKNRDVPEEDKIKALAAVVVLNKLYSQEKSRWKNGDYDLNNQGIFRYKQLGKYTENSSIRPGVLLQYGIASGVRFEDGVHQLFMDKTIEKTQNMSAEERIAFIHRLRGVRPNYNAKINEVRENYLQNSNRMFTINRYNKIKELGA